MAKVKGNVSAIYLQTTAASQSATGTAMSRVGTTLWYQVASSSFYYWDKARAPTIKDGGTAIPAANILEVDWAAGAVRLASAAVGAVTADHYKFACTQVGGFRSHSVDEGVELVECGCYEDDGEDYEAVKYSASGSAEGFYTTVDAILTTANGSNKDLSFISRLIGTPGNSITIACVVGGNNTPLSVAVVSKAITITSATNGTGQATSTARQIRDALEANADAMALVNVKFKSGQDGSGVFGAMASTALSGGVAPSVFGQFGQVLIGEFYWDSGTAKVRTSGLIELEKVSLKTGAKALVEKTVSWKAVGLMYEHSG